jgi:thymidine kinase
MSKIHFKYGVMGSAKSADALITAHRSKSQNKKVLLLTSSFDDRFQIGKIKSRAIVEPMEAIPVSHAMSMFNIVAQFIIKNLQEPDVIIVDESQFFTKEQIWDLVKICKGNSIPVICYGLRTDFKGDLFEGSQWLLAWADDIQEIPTTCSCGSKARMVLRKVDGKPVFDGEQVMIGDIEYESVCLKCFVETKEGDGIK